MVTLLIAIGSFILYLIAYHTYGKFLGKKIFSLDPNAEVPSVKFKDGIDYVPTKRNIIFGHHFTSIAGTGPIVGPALAVIWGWVPALLWVIFGSILIGAVHDFGALVVSLRNRGQTVGDSRQSFSTKGSVAFSINFIYGPDNRFGHFWTSDCLSIQNVSVGYFPMYDPNSDCHSNRNTNT